MFARSTKAHRPSWNSGVPTNTVCCDAAKSVSCSAGGRHTHSCTQLACSVHPATPAVPARGCAACCQGQVATGSVACGTWQSNGVVLGIFRVHAWWGWPGRVHRPLQATIQDSNRHTTLANPQTRKHTYAGGEEGGPRVCPISVADPVGSLGRLHPMSSTRIKSQARIHQRSPAAQHSVPERAHP